ncbi:hypothetical protein BZJ20_13785 [Salinivibrio proteolyticus]|nr:hypothetical protein BZJ20_13785 [Salinivibrio proteolyticus]
MPKYSSNKNIQKVIAKLVKANWQYKRCKKHGSLYSPGGKRFTVPGTPSDKRAFLNFKKDIQRVL